MKIKGFKDTIAWYDENAGIYAKKSENRANLDQIEEFVKLLKPKSRILDVGCGSGRDAKIFSSMGFEITGIDVSEGLFTAARKAYPQIDFLLMDFRRTSFADDSFDGIWSHASLVHLENLEEVRDSLKEFGRILKSGGVLHLYVKAQKGRNKTEAVSDSLSSHDRFFRYFKINEISSLLRKNKFEIIRIEEFNEAEKYPNLEGTRKNVDWILALARKL